MCYVVVFCGEESDDDDLPVVCATGDVLSLLVHRYLVDGARVLQDGVRRGKEEKELMEGEGGGGGEKRE